MKSHNGKLKKVGAVLTLLLGVTTQLMSSGLILGDRTTTADGDSFSFNLLTQAAFDTTNEYFYVAANEDLTGDARPYALAGTTVNAKFNTANQFVSFAPEKAMLNGVADTSNPLYGKKIGQLGIIGTQPIAVANETPTAIYWITSKLSATTQNMVGVTSIKDATGNDSPGVLVRANNSFGKTLAGSGSTLFAAVISDGQTNFGLDASGVAVFTKNTNNTTLTQEKAVWDSTDLKAVQINKTTDVLKLGVSNLDSLTANGIDLHWDGNLQRLYIALRVTDVGVTGARGIAVGYIQNQTQDNTVNKKLRLTGIAPSTAFTGATNTEIIANQNNGEPLDIYRARTMRTSTGLSYLIVESNVSDPAVRNNLYACALVDESADPNNSTWQTSTTHGTLAKKDSTPTNYFETAKNGIQHFKARAFTVPATAPGDLPTNTDVAAQIGGGVAPGNISDIQVYKDTVFISTHVGFFPETTGVFYSQALFDTDGKIVNWTSWQRVTYDSNDVVDGFAFVPTQGVVFTLQGTFLQPDKVKRTNWSNGSNDGLLGGTSTDSSIGFIEKVSAQFPAEQGGIMGLFDFDKTNPAFSQDDDENLSLMIATGYKKVVIVKTGTDTAGAFSATSGDFSTDQRTFTSGAISNTSTEGAGVTNGTIIISVSGGDLDDLGAITSAAIVPGNNIAGTDGYLVVGGTGGLALLRGAANEGWADTGLVKDLSTGLGTGLAFEKIDNYSNIRKLWVAKSTLANTYCLYVLTDDTLYRINSSTLGDATLTVTTLATLSGLGLPSYASFSDFVASKTLGLLATSHGLYRLGNGDDVSTETAEAFINWTAVTLPGSFTGVTKLLPLSKSALPYEFADTASGQVYYIASTVSYQNAALGRLAIQDASTAITSTTVQDVTQPVLKSSAGVVTQGPLSFLGTYRANFATNGATLLVTCPQEIGKTSKLVRLPLSIGTGTPFSYHLEKEIDLGIKGNILGLTRNSATGSWLVYGDFGLKVLE